MKKRRGKLLFKFAFIFTVFAMVAMFLGSIMTYISQTNSYKKAALQNLKCICDYLEHLIQESGEDFIIYQKYYMEHFSEARIPFNFTEYHTAQRNYEKVLSEMGLKKDENTQFNFDSFSEEAKMAYFVYIHEYWLLTFENARKAFNLPYTYYLVPKEEIYNMVYMIDGERTPRGLNGQKSTKGPYLYLGDEYHDPYEKCPVQWDTWFTGERQNKFQVWNNEWGHTYAFYVPLYIKGQKLGLIGAEFQVEDVNKEILRNAVVQILGVGVVLVICIAMMLIFINKRYIHKIVRLEANLIEYSDLKDPTIAQKIEAEITGNDEIASLSSQLAALILKIEDYIKTLLDTSQKLKASQARAEKMDALANRDALTGIRNKTAYDNELRRLEWRIAEGNVEFGIAMIDLNFLKRINDTFGHEQGNVAIKRLCSLVCQVFKHSPVFRIGGDEFVVILEHADLKDIDMLCMNFNIQIDALSKNDDLQPWEQVSAALGYAIYNKNSDVSVQNVFRRADKAMYSRKKEMKAIREI